MIERLRRVAGMVTTARRLRGVARRVGTAVVGALPVSMSVQRTMQTFRADARWMPTDGIEMTDHLNIALRGLGDADGSNRWLHHRWVDIFARQFDAVADVLDPRVDFDALYLGAGGRNPLALPLLLFMGGARRVYVVDPELGLRPAWRARWGLQEMILRIISGDVASRHFVRPAADVARFVDLRRLFFDADFETALDPGVVRLLPSYLEDCSVPAATIGLVASRSVLEHVTETERCFDTLAAMVRPGGVMYHDVDLTAHASDPFSFYFEAAEKAGERRTDGLNGLRVSDYVSAFEARGFVTEIVARTVLDRYDLARRPLRRRYRDYSEEDLRCSRAVLVCRRKSLNDPGDIGYTRAIR